MEQQEEASSCLATYILKQHHSGNDGGGAGSGTGGGESGSGGGMGGGAGSF